MIQKNFNQFVLKTLVFLFFSSILNAQQIDLVVKRGGVYINNKMYNEGDEIIKVSKNDSVKTRKNTWAIAKDAKNRMYELERNKKYSFVQIESKLNKQPQTVIHSSVKDIVFGGNFIQKSVDIGGTSRGIEENTESIYYWPDDYSQVLSKTISLVIGDENTKLITPITVINQDTKEEKKIELNDNKFVLENLNPGNYTWSYTISYQMNNQNKTVKFKNYFTIPNSIEKEKINNNIQKFKNDIAGFSEEMQKILLEDYLKMNKIII